MTHRTTAPRLPSSDELIVETVRIGQRHRAYRVTLDGQFIGLYFSRTALASALGQETESAA